LESRRRGTHAGRTWEGGSTGGTHCTWWRRWKVTSTRRGREGWSPLENFHFRVEPGSKERGHTKSLRRPAEARRRYKPRSGRRKMLGSEAEATWRRASARFIGRRYLVDNTLCLVVAKGWERRKHIQIGRGLATKRKETHKRNNPSHLRGDFARCCGLCELQTRMGFWLASGRKTIATRSRVMGQVYIAVVAIMFLINIKWVSG
jgi:hypothetical protein